MAAQLGYSYSYLGTDDVVTLTRPGLTILVRPGQSLFDVNDRSESMDAGEAPRFFRNDIYVSPSFVRRLTQLANRAGGGGRTEGLSAPIGSPVVAPGVITLEVHPVPGSSTLKVTGHAPAHAPITLDAARDVRLRHAGTSSSIGTARVPTTMATSRRSCRSHPAS